MSDLLSIWIVRTLLGGGAVLLLARLLLTRVGQPARQQRLGEFAMASALLLAGLCLIPAWLLVPNPWSHSQRESSVVVEAKPLIPIPESAPIEEPMVHLDPEDIVWAMPEENLGNVVPDPNVEPQRAAFVPLAVRQQTLTAKAEPVGIQPWITESLVWIYLAGAGLLLALWLLGHLALRRLLRRSTPAPAATQRIFAELTDSSEVCIRVSGSVKVPFSFGIVRPTIVLPASFCEHANEQEIRWVLAHELAHSRRRDAWTAWLFGLGQVFFYPLPWFWSLRRHVRLCQEYIADDAGARVAGLPEDYAELLLSWSTSTPAPAGATGVFGHSSDLFRRISMLLNENVKMETKCPRRWTLLAGVGLLSLAVVAAGIGLQATAAPAPAPKKEKKDKDKPAPKPEAKPKDEVDPFDPNIFPDVPNFEDLQKAFPQGGFDREQMKRMQEQMEQARKQMRQAMEQLRRNRRGGVRIPNFPNVRGMGFPGANFAVPNRQTEGRMGVWLQKPSATLVEQLDLPENQGLVIAKVDAGSAAADAGVKAHDILLELDGKPVTNDVAAFQKQLKDVKADAEVKVVVLRKGTKETLKGMKLPEAKQQVQANPFQFPQIRIGPNAPAGGVPNIPGLGGRAVSTTTTRTNDKFTTRHQDGDLAITIKGKVEDGKNKVEAITIQDGKNFNKYESVEKVPEAHRAKVEKLLEGNGQAGVRIELNPFGN